MLINKREKEKEEKNSAGKVNVVDLKAGSRFFENKIVPDYINTKLAADILGLSENALRIRVYRGQVPVVRFGRSLRFRITEIESLFTKEE